jgi:hypothetical protein
MKSSSPLKAAHKALIRRYLIWAYKSTKESFDRLERKTTQLLADEFILKAMSQRSGGSDKEYGRLLGEFKGYIENKKAQPVAPGKYRYFRDRLASVEEAITYFLGKKELASIRRSYEEEFVRRIWSSTEH